MTRDWLGPSLTRNGWLQSPSAMLRRNIIAPRRCNSFCQILNIYFCENLLQCANILTFKSLLLYVFFKQVDSQNYRRRRVCYIGYIRLYYHLSHKQIVNRVMWFLNGELNWLIWYSLWAHQTYRWWH